jgi:hypothetical protein
MTLYDVPESILRNASAVAARAADREADEVDRRELTQMSRLLGRIAAMWPGMFRSLRLETEVLGAALAEALAVMEAAGQVVPELPEGVASEDPLTRYRDQLVAYARLFPVLHRHSDQPWAEAAQRCLRRAVAESAELQAAIVDDAFAV